MPQSSFKRKVIENGAGVGRCTCGQTFECTFERELTMKCRIHRRFCFKPPLTFNKIEIPKKACTMREEQLAEPERISKVHN